MSTTILPIHSPSLPGIEPLPGIRPTGGAQAAVSFPDLISSSIGAVEQATRDAATAVGQFLTGENEDLHTVAIAAQKAELTSDLFLQLRNKAVSAYQEVMRMQL